MNASKYISVVPILETRLDLLPLGEQRYTWFPLWDDLRSLNRECLLDRFKLFVDQQDPRCSPPKLFVCTLIRAINEEEAYQKGTKAIRSLVNQLVTLLHRGFEVKEHEALIVNISPITKGTINIKLVELTIRNGNVKDISTPYGKWTSKFPQIMTFSHNGYLATFSKIQKIESDTRGVHLPKVEMLPKEILLNVDVNLRKMESTMSEDKKKLMSVVTNLYNAAVTMSNVSVSYLLLWQVLESFVLSEDGGEQLISGNTLVMVTSLLRNENYDAKTQQKVKSMLGMLTKKSEIDAIAEILKHYIFPSEKLAKLRKDIEGFRRMRGAIVHPKDSSHIDTAKLLASYGELRNLVEAMFRRLNTIDN